MINKNVIQSDTGIGQDLDPADYVLNYIKQIVFEQDLKLIVFGAGLVGMRLLSLMEEKHMPVFAFADNDPHFNNTKLFGFSHISIDKLAEFPEKYYILVTPLEPGAIVAQLQSLGFPHVDTSAMRALKFVPFSMGKGLWSKAHPLGHFYSLYPDVQDIMEREDEVFGQQDSLLGIDMNEDRQIELFGNLHSVYADLPRWPQMGGNSLQGLRYRTNNPSFPLGDAVALHEMLRYLKPKQMIEVGSGYSSAVTLDTNEFYLDQSIDLTFIEPYPRTLKNILKQTDHVRLIESGLQKVPVCEFERLGANDVLFIDSTHVSKIDSDVNYLFFEILPRLASGVYIHLHDICYPFTYPKEWIRTGMIWNEVYLLRAFLINNNGYEILYYQDMLNQKHPQLFENGWPYEIPSSGGSFWMRKK